MGHNLKGAQNRRLNVGQFGKLNYGTSKDARFALPGKLEKVFLSTKQISLCNVHAGVMSMCVRQPTPSYNGSSSTEEWQKHFGDKETHLRYTKDTFFFNINIQAINHETGRRKTIPST